MAASPLHVRRRAPAGAGAVLSALLAACGADAAGPPGPTDAGVEPRPTGCGATLGLPCEDAAACDDGCFCNGAEACEAGACVAGADPCDDGVACTDDACVEEDRRCASRPRDDACSDGDACNGYERCDPAAGGCVGVDGLRCDDGDACTIDACDAIRGCLHAPRDLDGDGVVDALCGGEDCNDDPRSGGDVYPGRPEVCGDGVDNDCDAFPDAFDGDCPTGNDTCETPEDLVTSGPFNTFGLADDLSTCAFGDLPDAVYRFTLEEPRDVTVVMRALVADTSVGVELRPFDDCGDDDAALGCRTGISAFPPAPFARNLPAGDYAVIVDAAEGATYFLDVETAPPTQSDVCGESAIALATPFGSESGDWADVADDHAPSCGAGDRVDAAYRLVLSEARRVRVGMFASGGRSTVALTDDCGDPVAELGCATGSGFVSLDLPRVEAGTWYVVAEPGDDGSTGYSVSVSTSPP